MRPKDVRAHVYGSEVFVSFSLDAPIFDEDVRRRTRETITARIAALDISPDAAWDALELPPSAFTPAPINTWESPSGETFAICTACEALLEVAGGWPKDSYGEEFKTLVHVIPATRCQVKGHITTPAPPPRSGPPPASGSYSSGAPSLSAIPASTSMRPADPEEEK